MKLFQILLSAFLCPVAGAQEDRAVVSVNGTSIRQSEVVERLWRRYGPETLEEMVDELLLRQQAQKLKVRTEPADVDRRFSRLRDQFPDVKSFEEQLERAGSNVAKLRSDITDSLLRERLVVSETKIAVSEDEIKKAFEQHRKDLGVPEKIHLLHLQVKTEAEAKALMKDVMGGSDFKTLARAKSLAPTGKLTGGDYGFVTHGLLPAEIEDIAFSLKPKEMRVITTARGAHLLQVLEKRPAVAAEFSKVKTELKDLLEQEKVRQILPEYLRKLRDAADIKPAS